MSVRLRFHSTSAKRRRSSSRRSLSPAAAQSHSSSHSSVHTQGRFFDSERELIAFDPAVSLKGSHALLIRKELSEKSGIRDHLVPIGREATVGP
jgi:hypothetical protein